MSLTDLPNIGKELARCLQAAGITTPYELRRIGSVEAAIRISPRRPSGSSCRSALCALEGAIRGVRWHSIPRFERDELWRRLQDGSKPSTHNG
jgi:DNA transformation protein